MTKDSSFYIRIFKVLDMGLVALSIWASCHLVVFLAPLFHWEGVFYPDAFAWAPWKVWTVVIAVPLILERYGFYRKRNLQRPGRAVQQLSNFMVCVCVLLSLYLLWLQTIDLNVKRLLWVGCALVPVVLFIRYYLCYRYMTREYADAEHLTSVVLMGKHSKQMAMWESLPAAWRKSFNVVGIYDPELMTLDEFEQLVVTHSVEQVVVFGKLAEAMRTREACELCDLQGIDVCLCIDNLSATEKMPRYETVENKGFLIFRNAPVLSWQMFFKTVLDKVGACLLLLVSCPLWLLAIIGIKVSDPKGPVFYKQKRSGLYGKPFNMWKFRSMYVDAVQRVEDGRGAFGGDMAGPVL